jgi:hypothetical protein
MSGRPGHVSVTVDPITALLLGLSISRRRLRRLAARLALFAILFQAILFGWHHHDLHFDGRLPAPVIENSAASTQPADDADGCEICQVLHHLTAATVDFTAAPPPLAVAPGIVPDDAAFVACPLALAFRARAPPSSDAANG